MPEEAKFHKYYKITDSNPIIIFFNPPYNLVQGDAEKNLFPLPKILTKWLNIKV